MGLLQFLGGVDVTFWNLKYTSDTAYSGKVFGLFWVQTYSYIHYHECNSSVIAQPLKFSQGYNLANKILVWESQWKQNKPEQNENKNNSFNVFQWSEYQSNPIKILRKDYTCLDLHIYNQSRQV